MTPLLVNPNTAARIKRLLGRQDGGEGRPAAGVGGQPVILVRCTSATAAGVSDAAAQCYPAVVIDPAATATAQDELGPVWLTLLGPSGVAVVPAKNGVYEVLLSGYLNIAGDERPRVFGVPAGGVSFDGYTAAASAGSAEATVTLGTGLGGVTFGAPIPGTLITIPPGPSPVEVTGAAMLTFKYDGTALVPATNTSATVAGWFGVSTSDSTGTVVGGWGTPAVRAFSGQWKSNGTTIEAYGDVDGLFGSGLNTRPGWTGSAGIHFLYTPDPVNTTYLVIGVSAYIGSGGTPVATGSLTARTLGVGTWLSWRRILDQQ